MHLWAIALLAVAVGEGIALVDHLVSPGHAYEFWLEPLLGSIWFIAVGVLIHARRPEHRIADVFLLGGLAAGGRILLGPYAHLAGAMEMPTGGLRPGVLLIGGVDNPFSWGAAADVLARCRLCAPDCSLSGSWAHSWHRWSGTAAPRARAAPVALVRARRGGGDRGSSSSRCPPSSASTRSGCIGDLGVGAGDAPGRPQASRSCGTACPGSRAS